MNTILLIGANGQIGWELQRALSPLGKIISTSRNKQKSSLFLDLTFPDSIRQTVRQIKPNIIVNAAAYTTVDKAEKEPDLAQAVNATAVGILAEEAKKLESVFVHYSTDYVFDGSKRTPYGEDDLPNPLNIYGRTKLAGEKALQAVGGAYLILRTSWVYGLRGSNFLLTMLRLFKEQKAIKLVNDQIGSPTWSQLIAETTACLLTKANNSDLKEKSGIYHISAAGETSRYDFAQAILQLCSIQDKPKLIPVLSREYPRDAVRPNYSVLSTVKLAKTFGLSLPEWRLQLEFALKNNRSAA